MHPAIFCLRDTTEPDFNEYQIDGLGPLCNCAQRGMYLYPTYEVTPGREGLGVLDAWMWARSRKDGTAKRHDLKESRRWIKGYKRVAEMAAAFPATRLVYLADPEGDLMPLMRRAQQLGGPADWLIRASHSRCLPDQHRGTGGRRARWHRASRMAIVDQPARRKPCGTR